jgi:hypothetical protein
VGVPAGDVGGRVRRIRDVPDLALLETRAGRELLVAALEDGDVV